MDQQEINLLEWKNSDNWSGPAWFGIYFSKKDSRTWVPKRIPGMGWTINLGNNKGAYFLLGFLIGLPLLTIAVWVLADITK